MCSVTIIRPPLFELAMELPDNGEDNMAEKVMTSRQARTNAFGATRGKAPMLPLLAGVVEG